MCSNKTLKCLLNANNASIVSSAYDKSKLPTNNQIKIYFKNKFKLCTGIDSKTTFNDLKLALLVCFYKDNKKSKRMKNHDYLKRKALNDYVICESVNEVEKVIDSNLCVLNELKRISQEEKLGDFKILHIMRPKNKLVSLNVNTIKVKSFLADDLPIEETSKDKDYNLCLTSQLIDLQLKKFDQFIEQRKAYIDLLEQYLDLLEFVETDSNLETLV